MKSGVKTSEFWLSLASIFSILGMKFLGVELEPESIVTAVSVIVSVYTGGRSMAKRRGRD